jgi:tetratricopeptide (TPR) repeat protein
MKKSFFILLSLVVLASLAGAAYLFAPARIKGRLGFSAEPSRTSPEASARSLEDQLVLFHESRIANQPKDAEAHRLLARALLERGKVTGDPADFDRAWAELDRGEALEPHDLRTLTERADLSLSRHRFGLGRALAEQGLQRAPDDIDLLGLAGDGAVEMGDIAGAETYYRERARLGPTLPSSWVKLARSAEIQGRLEEAATLMQDALDKAYVRRISQDGIAWIASRCAEIAMKRGKLDDARRFLDTALQLKPEHPLALEFLANLELWQGHPQAAEAAYRKLLSLRPRSPKIQLRLANLLTAGGNNVEAQLLRDESLRLFEQSVANGFEGYLRDLATIDLAAGRYQRAAELAARDLTLRPTVESRALYAGILQAAKDAGHTLTNFAPHESQDVHATSRSPVAVLSRQQ